MKSAFWCRHIFIAALVLLSPGVSNAMTVEQRPKEMTVLNPKFVEGFHHELANRAFSRLATARMVKTVDDQDALVFWSAYHQLEIFNLPIYQHVVEEWGIDNSVGWFTTLRATAVSLLPEALHGWMVSTTLKRTEDYVDTLKRLKAIGPDSEQWFLDYMVAQEELQVDLMKKAVAGDYLRTQVLVEKFTSKYQNLVCLASSPPTEQSCAQILD